MSPLAPPDLKPHEVTGVPLDDIFAHINPVMLYGKHLGLKGSFYKQIEAKEPKAVELQKKVTDLQDKIHAQKLLRPRGLYQFFRAWSEGNDLVILDSSKKEITRFNLPRQERDPYFCLADFVAPKDSGLEDFVGMFVVTAGDGVMDLANQYKEAGQYFESHAIAAIALESAEGFAELLHKRLRQMWGIKDDPKLTMPQLHDAQYHGKRFSFGYPACPNLEDQAKLWELLKPDSIGVKLSEEFMMEPEASVSALVFSHPQARYFNV